MKKLTAIQGSPFPGSSSEKIVRLLLDKFSSADWEKQTVDLSQISSDALLLRTKDETLDTALAHVVDSTVILAASPTYRATYTGLIKCFFDQLPSDALAGNFLVPIQTGGSAEHSLSIEHGLAPMVRTLGAIVVTKSIYAWGDHWNEDGSPTSRLEEMVADSAEEIVDLCRA